MVGGKKNKIKINKWKKNNKNKKGKIKLKFGLAPAMRSYWIVYADQV